MGILAHCLHDGLVDSLENEWLAHELHIETV